MTDLVDKPSTLQDDKYAIIASSWFINDGKILLDPQSFGNSVVSVGRWCCFASTIGKFPHPHINVIFLKASSRHLPEKIVPQGSASDPDEKYLTDKVFQKRNTSYVKRKKTLIIVH